MKFRIVASLLVIAILSALYVLFQPSTDSSPSGESSTSSQEAPSGGYSGLGK